LLIEIDGNREEVEGQKEKVLKALKFAEKVIEPKDKYEEEILWRGRRGLSLLWELSLAPT
jgi:hypothetical protein